MRERYALGNDAYDPRDNIIAGAAYLSLLRHKYGFPAMFAAYNDGPGNFDAYLQTGNGLPAETVAYLANITAMLGDGADRRGMRARKQAA
jgi:soluble lytic murein transglycosylase-like protein